MAKTGKVRMSRRRPVNVGPKTPDEVIRATRSRGVELAPAYYGTRQGQARALAFTVSGMASLEQLAEVKRSLDAALTAGDSFTAWRKSVLAGAVPLSLPDHRLELIWRNNLQAAYARGNGAFQFDHEDSHPFLMYDAVNDTRTRPAHARMDGTVKPVRDPYWSRNYPPNGHNCRCRVIALTPEQAAEQGGVTLAPKPDGVPDEGWDYDPRADATAALRKQLNRKRTKLPKPLADKLGPLDEALTSREALGIPRVRDFAEAIAYGRTTLDELIAETALTRGALRNAGVDGARLLQNAALARFRKEGILGGIRPDEIDYIEGAAAGSLQRAVAALFPATWTRAMAGKRLKAEFTDGRAFYNGDLPGVQYAYLNFPTGHLSTAIHEFSHHAQRRLWKLDLIIQDYIRTRTGTAAPVRLADLEPGRGFDSWEVTRPDQFFEAYVGKVYPESAYNGAYLEAMPMMFQALLADPLWLEVMLRKGDFEMLELAIGLVRGWRP